jgi:hypothetical protein
VETAVWYALHVLFVASALAFNFFQGVAHIGLSALALASLQAVALINRRRRARIC